MGDRKILDLMQSGIKKKSIRKLKREPQKPKQELKRETCTGRGAVWGIFDKDVPFGMTRRPGNYKPTLRPCMVLHQPEEFAEYTYIHMVPGTSHWHPVGLGHPPCLRADVPPEALNKTTWFLLYFSWNVQQKYLEKHFTTLTPDTVCMLDRLTGDA